MADDDLFCPICGTPRSEGAGASQAPAAHKTAGFKTQPAASSNVYQSSSSYSSGASSYSSSSAVQGTGMPALTDGETVVKTYTCCSLLSPKCTGYLSVTTKRLLFYAKASTSRVSKELWLESIKGVDCYYGTNISVGKIIIGVLLILVSLASFSNLRYGSATTQIFIFLMLVADVVLIILGFRKYLYLNVSSDSTSGIPIKLGEVPKGYFGNGALYSLAAEPTADTYIMMHELYALIQDLQNEGDLAVERWQQ